MKLSNILYERPCVMVNGVWRHLATVILNEFKVKKVEILFMKQFKGCENGFFLG